MEKLLIEYSKKGKIGVALPPETTKEKSASEILPQNLLRESELKLPEVSEPEVVRHFTNLSTMNHHVDKGFYPLGSCTMKYNPKINDRLAGLEELLELNPQQPPPTAQGALQIIYELEQLLCQITGMAGVTLQPAAGSHGELVGGLIFKKYHESKGQKRRYILVPDSAHGTNPSSATSTGHEIICLKSNQKGLVDIGDLKQKMTNEVAGLMLTNPNTLGLFEEEVEHIVDIVHQQDGLVYLDGANLNALLGWVKPADMGFDITHMNLHKTFSTPHGGGGPGSGPVGVVAKLVKYLPVPRIVRKSEGYRFSDKHPDSIGRILGSYGNFSVMVRAYVYLMMLGKEGIRQVSRNAILNANYLRNRLSATYEVPYNRICMHEFVASGTVHRQHDIKTLDIAKRLLDFGVHAPTVYFPLIVKEALMIEPTETESLEALAYFAEIMEKIDQEAKQSPETLHKAPYHTPVRRLDELKANKELNVSWS